MSLVCAAVLAGCVSSLVAKKVVAPPNKSGIKALFADSEIVKHAPDAFAAVWKVPAPGPAAELTVASIEPGNYSFQYDLQLSYPEGKDPSVDRFHAYWLSAKQATLCSWSIPSPTGCSTST